MGVVALAENKANSAPMEFELELGLSLAILGGKYPFSMIGEGDEPFTATDFHIYILTLSRATFQILS